MKLYTIGFTKKRANTFFDLLRRHDVQRLVDIRLNPDGQLSGFAKREDLPYFLSMLANGCRYVHMPVLAPTKELLKDYRTDSSWPRYEKRFQDLMSTRDVPAALDRQEFEAMTSCLLCSEALPKQCHRRLVAERLRDCWAEVEIVHL